MDPEPVNIGFLASRRDLPCAEAFQEHDLQVLQQRQAEISRNLSLAGQVIIKIFTVH